MGKQSERQKIILKLDRICRQILLIRDDIGNGLYQCICCGKIEPIELSNVSHYCGRAHLITRWDLKNIHLGCVHCNKWLSGNLIEYRKNLIVKIGLPEVERLERIYMHPSGYSAFDLSIIYEGLKGELKEYKAKTKALREGIKW